MLSISSATSFVALVESSLGQRENSSGLGFGFAATANGAFGSAIVELFGAVVGALSGEDCPGPATLPACVVTGAVALRAESARLTGAERRAHSTPAKIIDAAATPAHTRQSVFHQPRRRTGDVM